MTALTTASSGSRSGNSSPGDASTPTTRKGAKAAKRQVAEM